MAKELKNILDYMFLTIKIEIEAALSREFAVFDNLGHQDNNQGNMEGLQGAANLFAEINTRNKENKEKLEIDLNQGRVKLRQI